MNEITFLSTLKFLPKIWYHDDVLRSTDTRIPSMFDQTHMDIVIARINHTYINMNDHCYELSKCNSLDLLENIVKSTAHHTHQFSIF